MVMMLICQSKRFGFYCFVAVEVLLIFGGSFIVENKVQYLQQWKVRGGKNEFKCFAGLGTRWNYLGFIGVGNLDFFTL